MRSGNRRAIGAALLTVAISGPATAQDTRSGYARDGDSISLSNGRVVRVIGIDSPEYGTCGSRAAQRATADFIANGFRLVSPASVDGRDRYNRLLRYVRVGNRDLGRFLIRRGLAIARYDSLDGYDWHPRQAGYRRLDSLTKSVC